MEHCKNTNFELRVYNRWGEMVFFTKDPNFGWDGNFKGKKQNTYSFVWQVKYVKANDSKPVLKKGIITLIR
jgi:gliding motility-associated-like protein